MYPKRIPKHLIFDPHPKRKSKTWLWWLLAIALAAVVSLFSIEVLAAPNDSEHAGQLTFSDESGQRLPSLHLETVVTASISGLVVTTDYIQRFKNNSDQWVEGVYVFPLPEMAAVQRLEMKVGERRIIGEVKERASAETLYKKARSEGKRAALTLQQRDNLFTQKVANIGPRQEIEIKLTFIDTVKYQAGVFEWRLPTTLTPRYIPGISLPAEATHNNTSSTINTSPFGWATATDLVPDAPDITPAMIAAPVYGLQNPLQLNLSLQAGMELASIEGLYHNIEVIKQPEQYHIKFTNDLVEMDRDVVLQWTPVTSSQPRAAVFQQQTDGDTYAMVMMIPPNAPVKQALSKDIIFVIDTSGSMQGNSMIQAKSSLALAVDQLSPNDRFNIIAFSDRVQRFNDRTVLASADLKHIAKQWIASLEADGGTEMYPALQEAYGQLAQSERLQQIVFITDGAIGNEEMLFNLITEPGHNARLFTVGIGSAPNAFFMTKAAQLGRGSYELIGYRDDVYGKMSRLFNKLNHVAATNININWPQEVEPYPSQSADLFHSEALLAFAKLSQPLQHINISGNTAQQPWQTTIQANNAVSTTGIGALWARHKVADIEDQGRRGQLTNDSVRDAILDVALTHSLLTRFTALIAIEDTPVRPQLLPLFGEPVANVMPDGALQQRMQFANTATSATLTFWLGLWGVLAMFILHFNRVRSA
ncbi:marine proteobacterial sortase target protein [Alteromonas sp. AMM-1]|uniref:marine proteobacterial sortase target protein n=1 Tax=Alteromonas sp. AMM-1 TaxID=3394233 RepID=UPI0039A5C939